MEKLLFHFIWVLYFFTSCVQNNSRFECNEQMSDKAITNIVLNSYDSCNYFNEFKMIGIGVPKSNDFLYYKKIGNHFLIKDGQATDSTYIYSLTDDGWYNIRYYDFDRQCYYKDGKYPRIYLRWIKQDTIIEYVRYYSIDKRILNATVFIKTNNQCVFVNEKGDTYLGSDTSKMKSHSLNIARFFRNHYSDLSKVDHFVNCFGTGGFPNEKGYLEFEKTKFNGLPSFRAITIKDTIYYYSHYFSSFSITAGFEDLEEQRFTNSINQDTQDGIYDEQYVDILPRVLKCGKPIQDYIDEVYNSKKSGVKRNRVFIELTVSKSGQITKTHILKSVGKNEDAEALRLCNAIPKLSPAIKKGSAVPVRVRISVDFYPY